MTFIIYTLRKLVFHFLSHWMGYDRGDSFIFDFEPNGIPFGSKSKGILSPRSYPIQCEWKWKYIFLSAAEARSWSQSGISCSNTKMPPGSGSIQTLTKVEYALYTCLHTEKSFRILIESNRNQIVFTIFRLIWYQTDVFFGSKSFGKW